MCERQCVSFSCKRSAGYPPCCWPSKRTRSAGRRGLSQGDAGSSVDAAGAICVHSGANACPQWCPPLCRDHAPTRASQMARVAPRSLVTIADQMMHEEDIDADEYLWETLPGRCCFQELADDCDTCSVWSDPQNFCHMSSDNCEHCGAAPAPCGPVVPRTPAQRVRCPSQACLCTATRLRLYWMPTRFAKAIPRWE